LNFGEAQVTPTNGITTTVMYFVKPWITISAPNLAGDTDSGENVLSTNVKYVLQFVDNPAISATSSKGITTVSHKTWYLGTCFDTIQFSDKKGFLVQ
jgi:hypothetical protein